MIIGLTGFKGSGKSTVAEYLEKEHGFKRVNFKDALVEEMKERFPDVLEQLDTLYGTERDYLFKEKPPIMRALMQNYGTDVRRADDADYWVNKWLKKVTDSKDNIVVDDVRFWNELGAVRQLNGVIVRIVRDDIKDGGTHRSETEQEMFDPDFTIEGKVGCHTYVYQQIESVLDTLKKNVD